MRIFYGISEANMKIMRPRLKEANLPVIGFIPNKNPKANGRFVIEYWDGTKKYIKEDKRLYNNLYFSGNSDFITILDDLRLKALDGEPIELTR